MRRTDLDDTSPEAWRMLVQRLRQLSPSERARRTFDMIESMRTLRMRTRHLRPNESRRP